jgi:hypothetical protein
MTGSGARDCPTSLMAAMARFLRCNKALALAGHASVRGEFGGAGPSRTPGATKRGSDEAPVAD